MLVASASAVLVTQGCSEKKSETQVEKPVRRDVPLRVALVGSDDDAERLQQSWAAVVEQPLDCSVLPLDRADTSKWAAELPKLISKNDVAIMPQMAIADSASDDALLAFRDQDFANLETDLGVLRPACRSQALYAGELVATPLGAKTPALVTSEESDPIKTWAEYDSWVESINGEAAEPLADGWVATMFLWRAASSVDASWLFSREAMAPELDSQPYVDVLTQMQKTASRYKGPRKDAATIWTELNAGKLRGGIAMEFPGEESVAQLTMSNLPGEQSATRLMLDPFSPVACITAACRQTDASKQFVAWLSGGEGSDSMRRQRPDFSSVRSAIVDADNMQQSQTSSYQQWLAGRLDTPITVSPLQLLSAADYYQALDEELIKVFNEQADPSEALKAAADRWRELTQKVGVKKQTRAWRRSQGLG